MNDDIRDDKKEQRKLYLRKYYRRYYSDPVNRRKNAAGMRLNYWRKVYCSKFSVMKDEIIHKTEYQLRDEIKTGVKIG